MRDFPVVFHFKVEFAGVGNGGEEDHDIRFQEVTGMGAEIATEEYREGGLNEYVHRLPTNAKYSNLVLKRGYLHSAKVTDWCRKAIENFEFEPKDITVSLLNEKHEPIQAWYFHAAYPVKWSISDFKATDNAIVIESMELAYKLFRGI
jgi:phage tail-like protein